MANEKNHCNVGLDQRCRDNDGQIRQKRGDTLVKTLRKTYGSDFHREFGWTRYGSERAENHCPSSSGTSSVTDVKDEHDWGAEAGRAVGRATDHRRRHRRLAAEAVNA